jgi:RimJ/RimL family protein N-acetyltransferase
MRGVCEPIVQKAKLEQIASLQDRIVTAADSFPKQTIRLDCGDYLMRTVTVDDASDRWGRWLADPVAASMLNLAPKSLTKAEIRDYVTAFDQRTHILLGIFAGSSGQLVGITRVDIDPKLGRFLVSMLIGEPDYRHKGVSKAVTRAFRDYFFETLGLKTLLATVLAHNQPMINYFLKSGCHLDKTIERQIKSRADGSMLGMCYFSLTRDAWRKWKSANTAWPDIDRNGPRALSVY